MSEKTIVINEDLRLRPLTRNDAEELQQLADNKKIWRWVRDRFPHPFTVQDAHDYLDRLSSNELRFYRAIEFQDKLVGVIGLKKREYIYRFSAEMGYWIGEPFWNMGFATQAVKAMLEIAFEDWKLERVDAFTMQGNDASQRVLEKAEFTYEGVKRKGLYKDGKFHDEYFFSILKEEYNQLER